VLVVKRHADMRKLMRRIWLDSHLCELVVSFRQVLLKEPMGFVLIGFSNGKAQRLQRRRDYGVAARSWKNESEKGRRLGRV
jgi:hypothetical protein